MTKRAYTKPALTYPEQLEQLKSRGLIVDDDDRAMFYLQHINYYRLAAYWQTYECDDQEHAFENNTSFEQILDLYTFDRELRLLILDAIERIEVSVRAQWAYCMGHWGGPHAYLKNEATKSTIKAAENIVSIQEEIVRTKEKFIYHHLETYEEELPAIWAVCEVISFGLLSRIYGNMKVIEPKIQVADVFELNHRMLTSWLHHLSVVRNTCAHHARLWNRDFSIRPESPKTKPELLAGLFQNNNRIYNTLLILLYFMDIVSPDHHWRIKLLSLLNENKEIDLQSMGFPDNWQANQIWQIKTE